MNASVALLPSFINSFIHIFDTLCYFQRKIRTLLAYSKSFSHILVNRVMLISGTLIFVPYGNAIALNATVGGGGGGQSL